MSNTIKNISGIVIIVIAVITTGCKKYLEKKSDQSLVIPSSVQDLQSLLDNYLQVNQRDPAAAEVSSDNYYLTENDFQRLNERERNMYTWQADNLFASGIDNDWARCYNNVNRANQVLLYADKIKREQGDEAAWSNVKGHALYLRGRAFLFAVSLWSLAYDPATASTDAGIPLLLDPSFDKPSSRASVEKSYQQAIADLKEAVGLLPAIPLHKIRPSKAAALGMVTRAYLWMRQYDSCLVYAEKSLQLNNSIKNYNELNGSAAFPFAPVMYTNDEDLSAFVMYGPPLSLYLSFSKIDSLLYRSYNNNDLRKKIFFAANTGAGAGTYSFKGSYSGNATLYDGITVAEVLLMRAECLARAGSKELALGDLNRLLTKRWDNSVSYVPFTAVSAAAALQKILEERRKELLMRGLRWMDIKRLNKEGAGIILIRKIGSNEYTLLPNDKRYALPIPDDVIALSGMPQNER